MASGGDRVRLTSCEAHDAFVGVQYRVEVREATRHRAGALVAEPQRAREAAPEAPHAALGGHQHVRLARAHGRDLARLVEAQQRHRRRQALVLVELATAHLAKVALAPRVHARSWRRARGVASSGDHCVVARARRHERDLEAVEGRDGARPRLVARRAHAQPAVAIVAARPQRRGRCAGAEALVQLQRRLDRHSARLDRRVASVVRSDSLALGADGSQECHRAGDGWIEGMIDGWIEGMIDGWIEGMIDDWIEGMIDVWIEGMIDGWIEGYD